MLSQNELLPAAGQNTKLMPPRPRSPLHTRFLRDLFLTSSKGNWRGLGPFLILLNTKDGYAKQRCGDQTQCSDINVFTVWLGHYLVECLNFDIETWNAGKRLHFIMQGHQSTITMVVNSKSVVDLQINVCIWGWGNLFKLMVIKVTNLSRYRCEFHRNSFLQSKTTEAT